MSLPQHSFSEAELEINEANKETLILFLQSGDAILMAGAGCSASLFPAWSQFISQLDAEAKMVDPAFAEDPSEFLIFADKVKVVLGADNYYAFINQKFQAGNPTHEKFHETLCRIPFKGFTTTNYDRVLEYALNVIIPNPDNSLHFEGTTKNKIHEFLLSLNYNTNSRKRIAHLHGIHDQQESIILSEKEYTSKYGFTLGHNTGTLFDQIQGGGMTQEQFQDLMLTFGYEWPIRRKLLWSLLATRRLFFVGFSMNDPYFIKMLEFVKNDLSTYRSETHFLLLRITSEDAQRTKDFAAMLKQNYGIITVFFEDPPGTYPGFGNFITELEQRVNVTKAPVPVREEPTSPEIHFPEGDATITQMLFDISAQQQEDED